MTTPTRAVVFTHFAPLRASMRKSLQPPKMCTKGHRAAAGGSSQQQQQQQQQQLHARKAQAQALHPSALVPAAPHAPAPLFAGGASARTHACRHTCTDTIMRLDGQAWHALKIKHEHLHTRSHVLMDTGACTCAHMHTYTRTCT